MKLFLATCFIALIPAFASAQTDAPKPAPVEPVLAKYHAGYGRVGVRLGTDKKTGLPQIIALIHNGSAQYYGLKVGDILVRIDKNLTSTLSGDEISLALRGPVGSSVEVAVQREDNPHYFVIAMKRQAMTPFSNDKLNPPTDSLYEP